MTDQPLLLVLLHYFQIIFNISNYIEPVHDIANKVVYAQSDHSLCKSLEYYMIVELLTEHLLEFLSLKGGYTGSSESTLVKMPNYWKPHATALISMGMPMFL